MVAAELIRERVEYWRCELGLAAWFIEVGVGPIAGGYQATCSKCYREYKFSRVDFDPSKIEPDELDALVIHEMCAHMLTWPLIDVAEMMAGKSKKWRQMVELANEATTTDIERLILRLKGLPHGGTVVRGASPTTV